jgi:hypothetical protein
VSSGPRGRLVAPYAHTQAEVLLPDRCPCGVRPFPITLTAPCASGGAGTLTSVVPDFNFEFTLSIRADDPSLRGSLSPARGLLTLASQPWSRISAGVPAQAYCEWPLALTLPNLGPLPIDLYEHRLTRARELRPLHHKAGPQAS